MLWLQHFWKQGLSQLLLHYKPSQNLVAWTVNIYFGLWGYGSAGWLFWSQLGSLMCWVSSVDKVNSSGDLGWPVSHVWGLTGYCWPGMALVGTSGLSFTCSLIFQKLAWYVHMWYQSSKNAKWKYKGLLVPRLKTDILSLLPHCMGQNKSDCSDSRVGK